MKTMVFVTYILLSATSGLLSAQTASIIRDTKYGQIHGYSVPFEDGFAEDMALGVFVGVPYARPPLGELRWRDPEDPDPWEGVREATRFSPCCPQDLANIRRMSFGPDYNNTAEDCLYLNIYSPTDPASPSQVFPVMVWIHGGSYRYGSGEEYEGRILAQEGGVLVVTLNYRLGVLGFLSTDDITAEGNYALKDMIQALSWIQDNIANFGGDPSAVTLFGNSAGGAAVATLMFIDEAEGLFHRVIAQSGDATSPWAVYRPPHSIVPHTQALAEALDCPTHTNQDMVDCLRTKDALEIVNTPIASTVDFNAAFCPRVDGEFLKAPPEDLLHQGLFHRVDLLTGTVPDETSDEYTDVDGIEAGWARQEKEDRMHDWSRRYEDHADLIYHSLLQEYDSPGDDWQQQRDLFIEMRSDDGYIAPHNNHARGHSRYHDNTYLYSFEYLSANAPFPEWMGVPHVEECTYIFGVPFHRDAQCPWGCHNVIWQNRQNWTAQDEAMSRDVMRTWAAFAAAGNPSTEGFSWPAFDVHAERYGQLGNTWSAQQFYKYRRMSFWNIYRHTLLNTTAECTDDVISGVDAHLVSMATIVASLVMAIRLVL